MTNAVGERGDDKGAKARLVHCNQGANVMETVPKQVHQLESKPWRAMSMARWLRAVPQP